MIFEAIERVLADLDEAGEGEHGDDWDGLVGEALASLPGSYSNLTDPMRVAIDYSALATQAAYVFMYVARHADFIHQILARFRAQQAGPFFPAGTISVSSLGGGPGSELLGLLKYLDDPVNGEAVTKIVYYVLDKETGWENVASAFVDAVTTDIEIEFHFIELDVADEASLDKISLEDDDLVFVSYFISEVCAIQPRAVVDACITGLFRTVQNHALVVYNDSGSLPFYRYFNQRKNTARHFYELLEMKEDLLMVTPKFSGIIEDYVGRFDRSPKPDGFILAKVCQRQLP